MRSYVLRRLGQSVVVLFLITLIVFGISRLSGSPVDILLPQGAGAEQRAALTEKLGLDQPLVVQYGTFLLDALRGDFGQSTHFQAPALGLVLDRLPATIELAVAALLLALIVGVPLGTLAALRHGRPADYATTTALTLGQASPPFWIGILLILAFGVKLRLLPFAGNQGLESLILPAVTLSIVPLVNIARVTRSSVLGVLPADYVRTARAKGLRRHTVVLRHIVRNGLIPVVTVAGIVLGHALSGAVITEQIFSWPGIGALAIESIEARDYAVVQAVTIVTAVFVVGLNLLVDLSYFALDPRIRAGKGTTR